MDYDTEEVYFVPFYFVHLIFFLFVLFTISRIRQLPLGYITLAIMRRTAGLDISL